MLDHPGWLLLLLILVGWQGWLTLFLFGSTQPWQHLLDDQPILSGRHPLHLYHGYLGARSLRERGMPGVYDPWFHAGYPKTPIFDEGSRPAELALTLVGGEYRPQAYKVLLAVVWGMVPLLLFISGRAVGLSRGPACLACTLGLLVWWGKPAREALEAGDLDLLLATLMVLTLAGLLLRYHRTPTILSLLGVVASATLAWFAHPLLMALMVPLFLVYYISVGSRHHLAWHLALLGGLTLALVVNSFWLLDWIWYWWLRVPGHLPATPTHGTVRSLWDAPFWGSVADRGLAVVLVVAGSLGVLTYNGTSRRATTRLLGMGWAGLFVLALLGHISQPLNELGSSRLLVPALLFACLPATHAVQTCGRLLHQLEVGGPPTARAAMHYLGVPILAGLVFALWWMGGQTASEWAPRFIHPQPLQLGLKPRHQAIIKTLREQTTADARVLWEDRQGARLTSRWTPLLPLLTHRPFVGGLDSTSIEHTAGGFVDGNLAGRPINDWSDEELGHYCQGYNIGWIVCWTKRARARIEQWSQAQFLSLLPEPEGENQAPGVLYRLRRKHSYALLGSAHWQSADARQIVLANVVPAPGTLHEEDGQVVLSLHYLEGMRATPSRVQLERNQTHSPDSIPFVRLRVADPVARVTITWEKP